MRSQSLSFLGRTFAVIASFIVMFAVIASLLGSCESPKPIPQAVTNLLRQATDQSKKGNHRDCVESINQALSIYSDSGDAYAVRGICRYRLGEIEGAIEDLETGANIAERKRVPAKAEKFRSLAQNLRKSNPSPSPTPSPSNSPVEPRRTTRS